MVAGHWSLWTQHAAAGRRRLAAGDWRRAPQTTWWTIDSPRASIRAFRGGSPHGPWALHRGMAPPRKARWLFRSAVRRTAHDCDLSVVVSCPHDVFQLPLDARAPTRAESAHRTVQGPVGVDVTHVHARSTTQVNEVLGTRCKVRGTRYEKRKAKGPRRNADCKMRNATYARRQEGVRRGPHDAWWRLATREPRGPASPRRSTASSGLGGTCVRAREQIHMDVYASSTSLPAASRQCQ